MASAKKIEVIERVQKVVYEDKLTLKEVVLTLTVEEACFLKAITQRIAGSPDKSRRGLSDKIGEALEKIVGWQNNHEDIIQGMQVKDTK